MLCKIASSSIFRRCAELVAPVSGWIGGLGTFRGGERVNVFAEEAELVDLSRVSNTEKESTESCLDCGACATVDDSKKEKSASAHASTSMADCCGGSVVGCGGGGGVEGRIISCTGVFAGEGLD